MSTRTRPSSWLLLVLVALAPVAVSAQAGSDPESVTFYRDVLPILQENCQDCHRSSGTNYGGMVAPMSLLTYEDARPWARSIARQVSARNMPPWHAAPDFHGVFANERTLSEEEIGVLLGWASQGARRGAPEDAPPPRTFEAVGGWLHGEPDLVVDLPISYEVGDDVEDRYTAFAVDLTPEMLPEDVYIRGFQCKPGVKIVHHFNAHILYPDAEGELPPPPDKPESATVAPQGAGIYLGGVSSGSGATMYPEGYGIPLRRGTRVTFDIHYHKEAGPGTRVVDGASQIGFYFTREPPKSPVSGVSLFHFDIEIPPRDGDHQIGPISREVREDSEIVALMPHMHMRGKSAKFEAFYPDGTREVLLEVPSYDFSWQTVYYYDELKSVPKGTRIEYTAWYDNSEEYADLRGFDSSQTVRFGQASTDEMVMGFVMLAPVVE